MILPSNEENRMKKRRKKKINENWKLTNERKRKEGGDVETPADKIAHV